MAVPTSGTLTLLKLAREAKYADYNGNQTMGTIAMYDIVNGGNTHGSTISYPALNRNCLPNPTGSLPNSAANPCDDGLDVCFIIDYTGSMGDVIETVKDGLADVIAHINTESNSDYRLSMITVDEVGGEGGGSTPNYASCTQYTSLPTAQKYSNQGSSGLYQIITAWEMFPPSSNNNSTTFTTAVDNLNGGVSGSSCIQLGNGAGIPEPMDIGLGLVINSTNFVNNFRSAAAKYIIMITDASPGGGDDAFTEADYNQVLVHASTCVFRGIKVFVLGLGVNSNVTVNGTARYPWRELADQTGGTWDTTYDTTDVEADITVACNGDGVYAPYKFSAWYGYDQDCTTGIQTFSSAQIQSTSANACLATINQTYYHNGSASAPAVGDECYVNQNQTTVLAAGYYLTSSGGGIRITSTTTGTVASLFTCSTRSRDFRYAFTVGKPVLECDVTRAITTEFWHDGSNILPANGDACYTTSTGNNYLADGRYSISGTSGTSKPMSVITISGGAGVISAATLCIL
jgi:hypothetical protein